MKIQLLLKSASSVDRFVSEFWATNGFHYLFTTAQKKWSSNKIHWMSTWSKKAGECNRGKVSTLDIPGFRRWNFWKTSNVKKTLFKLFVRKLLAHSESLTEGPQSAWMLNSLLDLKRLWWISRLDVLQKGKLCLIFPSKDFEFCVQRKFESTSDTLLAHLKFQAVQTTRGLKW
jgi:hypothetical protein